MNRRPASHVMPTYRRGDGLRFRNGEGSRLTTEDGDVYLDFCAGIAANVLGHRHPALVARLREYADRPWHVSNLHVIPEQEALADALCAATFADLAFFCNSGTEAVEGMIKCMRKFHAAAGRPDRHVLITFAGAFHGRTLTALAASGNEAHLDGFGPRAPGFVRCPAFDLRHLESMVDDATAGIVLEPVQGEGGARDPGDDFLRGVRRICDDKGILLGLDEVQTGMGRTGKLFAHEWSGIRPDVMSVAKGLGGGFPIGAVLTTDAVGCVMRPGTHGSTHGGNPLACGIGARVLDIVRADGFLEHVVAMSAFLRDGLQRIIDAHGNVITGLRGRGLLVGLACRGVASDLLCAMRARRLIAVGSGDPHVVRLLPPLTVTKDEVETALECIEASCGDLAAGHGVTRTE